MSKTRKVVGSIILVRRNDKGKPVRVVPAINQPFTFTDEEYESIVSRTPRALARLPQDDPDLDPDPVLDDPDSEDAGDGGPVVEEEAAPAKKTGAGKKAVADKLADEDEEL